MGSSHTAPQSQRTLLIWTVVAVVALIAVFIGIDSASKQKSPNTPQKGSLEAVTEIDHVKGGNFSSPVTLVEYSDFQCPACGAFYPITKKLLEANGAKVRFVYRYFPLEGLHPNALGAAKTAEAAGKQNKFWEMHDLLFERQKEWSNETNIRDVFARYASELGLNAGQFITDLESADTKTRIKRDTQSGERAGLEGTPTFFINGEKIDNPSSYDEFQKLIDSVVAKKS